MTLAEVIAAEIARARRELAECEQGEQRNPDDAEWPLMVAMIREEIAAIERIEAARVGEVRS